MKHVLITGGAGFIGYHLAEYVRRTTTDHITIVDNLSRGQMDQDLQELLAHKDRLSFIQADLTDNSAYQTLPTNIDQAYHLAATNGTRHFYEKPYQILRQDTLLNIQFLDWVTTLEKKPKLLYTSTCETYAGALEAFNQLPLPTPEDVPRVISDIHNPRWSYAASKILGEMLFIHFGNSQNIPTVIVDPHNFYGPREGYDHVLPELIERIQKQVDPFPIYGTENTRAFCYIDDAVEAMTLAMNSNVTDQFPVQTFHIGDPQEHSIQEMAELLFEIAGWRPSSIESRPAPKGSTKRRSADPSKIEHLFGWKRKISLQEGLRRMYAWYQQHPKLSSS